MLPRLLLSVSEITRPLELEITEVSEKQHAPVWLNPELFSFLSTLLWQGIIFWILYFYRNELRDLLVRITSVKILGTELTAPIQEPTTTATKVEGTPLTSSERDAEGFFTEKGIKELVLGTLPRGKNVVDALLILKTLKQHTWLVATNEKLYCVLDDANRRETGKLVQWKLPLADANPISVKSSGKPAYGFLDIDNKTYWYYSQDLFPEPEALRSAVSELIRKAKESPPLEELPIPR